MSTMKLCDKKKRVKLYNLNKNNEWCDLATGFVFIMQQPPFSLIMINESTKTVKYQISLHSKVKFHLQKNTIITWQDPCDLSDDNYALSFENREGLNEIWNAISIQKGNDAKEIRENENILAEISFDNLPFIIREIQPGIEAGKANILLQEFKGKDCLFFKYLARLFEEEEKRVYYEKVSNCSKISNTTVTTTTSDGNIEQKKMTNFSLIFHVVKNIILMADIDLLARLMCDDLYLLIFGALEYDFESPKVLKHRQFLCEESYFHNILCIKNIEILSKIKMNYRLEYLRDIAMIRYLDMNGFAIINELIQRNYIDIVQFCLNDKNSLQIMIQKLVKGDLKMQYQVLELMIELIKSTKDLFSRLTHLEVLLYGSGVLQGIKTLLLQHISKYPCKNNQNNSNITKDIELSIKIRLRAIEILKNFLKFIPNVMKDYFLNDTDDITFISILTSLLKNEQNLIIKIEISDMIKLLIEMNQDIDINLYHHMIFDKCMNDLIEFLNYDTYIVDTAIKSSICASKQIIIELLSHCLNKLNDNVQYWFIHNSIIDKVLYTINEQNKELTLSVVKFIKNIISTNNYNYHKSIILSECFEKLFLLFNLNKRKNNLIFSSIMSIFDYLIKDDHSNKLLTALFKDFKAIIYSKENELYFSHMIKRYEIGKEYLDIAYSDSIGFHGLSSCHLISYFKEEEFIDDDHNHDSYRKNELISSFSFLNDNILSKVNKASTLFFLGHKRSNENEDKVSLFRINIHAYCSYATRSEVIICNENDYQTVEQIFVLKNPLYYYG